MSPTLKKLLKNIDATRYRDISLLLLYSSAQYPRKALTARVVAEAPYTR